MRLGTEEGVPGPAGAEEMDHRWFPFPDPCVPRAALMVSQKAPGGGQACKAAVPSTLP